MDGMFTAAATTRTTATRVTLAVSAARAAKAADHAISGRRKKPQTKITTTTARINSMCSMADSLRGLPNRVLQGSIQSCGEERGEAFLEQARVVAVLGLAAGDQLHRVGRRQGIGERAEHEVNAPYQLLARHLRQGSLERRLVTLHGGGVQMADQGAARFRRHSIGAPELPGEIPLPSVRVLYHSRSHAD